jgi:hypothetical protein
MNCREVNQLLVAYLDNEIIPSERTLIQSHLAGCEKCQRDLAALSSTRNRLSQSLKARAAQATPSPQALSRLQARLADEAHRPSHRLIPWLAHSAPNAGQNYPMLQGTMPMKTKIAFSVLAGLLLIGATAAFVPPVRAQIVRLFTVIVSGPVDITDPNLPGYLPEFNSGPIAGGGSAQAVDVNASQTGTFENIYQKGDKFLVFTQSGDITTLPDGQAITVNGQPGILTTGLSGQYRQDVPDATGAVDQNNQPVKIQPITIDYTDANKLTWVVGNTKYQLLSNLSVEEMLKIATELVPAK